MKAFKVIFLSFVLMTSIVTYAQKGVLKSEKPYSAHAKGWMVDLNKAYAESEKTGKPILANFTGSDWCGWCKKLKYEVFDHEEFMLWAKKNVVLLEIDFPRRFQIPQNYKEQNRSLQQVFKVSGYPTIWVFNMDKNENGQFNIAALGKTGYIPGGPKGFQKGVEEIINNGKKNN